MGVKQTEALTLALEALESGERFRPGVPIAQRAITALREALAEQPAEYASESDTEELIRLNDLPEPLRLAAMLEKTMQWPLHGKAADCLRKMYAAMAEQPAQQQEPVAWATYLGEYAHVLWGKDRPEYPIRYEVPLYTSPQPSKPWVGLTDEEIQKEFHPLHATGLQFARAIEAKLRSKNA